MNPEAFLNIANQVIKLKMFPYFDIAHCVSCALAVKKDLGAEARQFSRKHPLALLLSYMLVVFSESMTASALLAEPILAPLKNTPRLILAALVWYVIFYSPLDIAYKIANFLPLKMVCAVMKEIYRCQKIYVGVAYAAKLYPNAYVIMVIIGTLRGNGAGFVRPIERLIRGVWTPTATEFMQPSFYTKSGLVASIIFVLHKKTELITAPYALVYFVVVVFFVYFKLSSMLLGLQDPFVPFENVFCSLFLGGVWDSLAKIFARKEGQTKDAKKLY